MTDPARRPERARRPAGSRNPALRAEPGGIGSSGARDPLAREVKLLGALLGQVIVEQAGAELLELVERIRRRTIALRSHDDPIERAALAADLAIVDDTTPAGLARTEAVIRAFSLYFRLVNLAEERHRVRTLGRRARAARRGSGAVEGSIAAAVNRLRPSAGGASAGRAGSVGSAGGPSVGFADELAGRLRISPVLTAHPTEARRRTLLLALRRCAALVERLDDPRLTPDGDAEVRRRLREEITLLWRTADLRSVVPNPLDEVRTAMTFFDETLFRVVPRVYRALDAALDDLDAQPGWPAARVRARSADPPATDTGRTGTRPPRTPAFLRWGSWIGGDRDGNPNVTAEITAQALRIQSDHVLRGYENVAARLMQTVSVTVPEAATDGALTRRLAHDADEMGDAMRSLDRRFPSEPYRRRLGAMAERLRRTRAGLVGSPAPLAGRYETPEAFIAEIAELQSALVAGGLDRVAWGELQELRWQAETFGFHLASLEIRQHAAVHDAALEALRAGRPLDEELPLGRVTAAEVIATFRAIASLQGRFGSEACRRYVISFTTRVADVEAVLELARWAGNGAIPATATSGFGPGEPILDVVPLLESAEALESAGELFSALVADPAIRSHLRARGDRMEVMLGYSDSNKESGFLAANWLLYGAQTAVVRAARAAGIELTLFHGRGGAIGRGGGPAGRAILGQAAGSVAGRLKLTEQGEVIAAHYADAAVARRELEQTTGAVLLASTPAHEARLEALAAEGGPLLDELAATARRAYLALVRDEPGFAAFFAAVTPIGELSDLRFGSRPAARSRRGETTPAGPAIDALRAIPWVFAWSQARLNLPGWYGLGSALAALREARGEAGLDALADLYARWPFVASVLDNAEMSLAKADLGVAGRYAALASGPAAEAIWQRIEAEYRTTTELVLRVTGRAQLLDGSPVLQRSIGLRNPYVDSLSELQVRLLARLRAAADDDPARDAVRRLVQLTVNGVAAGLQTTG